MLLLLPSALASDDGKSGVAFTGCDCHSTTADSATTASLSASTATITPGGVISITIALNTTNTSRTRAGFDLVADGGTFTAISGTKTWSGGTELTHSNASKAISSGAASWVVNWTAPSVEGTYDLDAAVLGGNNNHSTTGDGWNLAPTLTLTVDDGCEDVDGDGVTDCDGDCDDTTGDVYPGRAETCDGIDNNCDEVVDTDAIDLAEQFPDADGDGFGSGAGVDLCPDEPGYAAIDGDCDETDAGVNPDAAEVCNERDDDCDGRVDHDPVDGVLSWADGDGDGYGQNVTSAVTCAGTAGWATVNGDCDDGDALVSPVGTETCDDVDQDCDGAVDEDAIDELPVYDDLDGDTFGDATSEAWACAPLAGQVTVAGDCEDGDARHHPGAPETCDGLDEDCDGVVDEDATDPSAWYADADGDGYGDTSVVTSGCLAPEGHTSLAGDCDDADARYNPGATETDCTDPSDYNCDGSVGASDADADGFYACEECDDRDASVFPGAAELCNEHDDNCDGAVDEDSAADATSWYADGDGDGYGSAPTIACAAPTGFVGVDGDCDDTSAVVYPGRTETCDGVDEDCDGAVDLGAADALPWYADGDGDGWGGALVDTRCEAEAGEVGAAGDCDDSATDVSPDATETCDDRDEDCDGVVDEDASDATSWHPDDDEDGYGDPARSTLACDAPDGTTVDTTDCDDNDDDVHPGGDEVWYDGEDQDCDGNDDDQDGDGLSVDADCDDEDATVGEEPCPTEDTGVVDDTGDTGDTGDSGDSGVADDSPVLDDTEDSAVDSAVADTGTKAEEPGCGCQSAPGLSPALLIVALLTRRTRRPRES